MKRFYKSRKYTKYVIVAILLTLLYHYYHFSKIYDLKVKHSPYFNQSKSISDSNEVIQIHSKCLCQKETVYIRRKDEHTYKIQVESGAHDEYTLQYELDRKFFESSIITCDLYNALRRGPNQQILSYSFPDENELTKNEKINIKSIIEVSKNLLPKWTIRVYHRNKISQSAACELQCFKKHKKLFDNIEFCDINQLAFNFHEYYNLNHTLQFFRDWLVLADDFVDATIGRDLYADLTSNELYEINKWMNSKTLFQVYSN